jgi:hypothetical protein
MVTWPLKSPSKRTLSWSFCSRSSRPDLKANHLSEASSADHRGQIEFLQGELACVNSRGTAGVGTLALFQITAHRIYYTAL